MASANRERVKIQSPQNSVKLASSVKQSYESKDIRGHSFGQPSPVNRDESTSVLLTSTSIQMMSAFIQCMWHM
jgi:hypothetical protein